MLKKIHIFALMLTFAFCLTSCSNTTAQDDGKADTISKDVKKDTASEDDKVTDAVKVTWKKMYPNETDPDWQIDKNGNFEASFKKKGVHYRADFNPDGTWVETENSLKKKELPKAIEKLLKEKYDDFKIVELEFVKSQEKGEFYDLELKEKGDKKFDLMVRANGEVMGRGE